MGSVTLGTENTCSTVETINWLASHVGISKGERACGRQGECSFPFCVLFEMSVADIEKMRQSVQGKDQVNAFYNKLQRRLDIVT